MVTLDCLDALDHLLWLRTGARAAEALGCNQSTVSRNALKCQKVFEVKLVRRSAEWLLVGDAELLSAERLLHQRYRWEMGLPLRFEAQHWLRDFYAPWAPADWVKGNQNYGEYERPLYLLRNRIIDAWLCCAPDVPSDPDLTCVQLCEMPMVLVAHPSHPLLQQEEPLTIEAVAAYPLLPLPQKAFPVFEAQMAALGLSAAWRHGLASAPGQAGDRGPIEDLCIGIASPLTLSQYPADWRILPVSLPIRFGDVLVIHSDFAEHPRSQQLICGLLEHLRAATSGMEDLQILGTPVRSPAPLAHR